MRPKHVQVEEMYCWLFFLHGFFYIQFVEHKTKTRTVAMLLIIFLYQVLMFIFRGSGLSLRDRKRYWYLREPLPS